MRFSQTTVEAPVTVSGIGMHTGSPCEVTIRPAPQDHGIQFVVGAGRIPARAAFVVNTRRCTGLACGTNRVDTIEHLMSALAGMQVDNAEIVVEGSELPILDGSAQPWVDALIRAGICRMKAQTPALVVDEAVALRIGEAWYLARPSDRFGLTSVTHYDHPLLGTQVVHFDEGPREYARRIAPARTFGFASEVRALLEAGLARGGTLDNALIINDDGFSSPERVPNECATHKALDLIGDLSLAGGRLAMDITAIMPSHRANTEFAALLAAKAHRTL